MKLTELARERITAALRIEWDKLRASNVDIDGLGIHGPDIYPYENVEPELIERVASSAYGRMPAPNVYSTSNPAELNGAMIVRIADRVRDELGYSAMFPDVAYLCNACARNAEEKGFGNTQVSEDMANIFSEVGEAWEEWRGGKGLNDVYFEPDGKPCGVPTELADIILRIYTLCGAHGIDLHTALKAKFEYNRMVRPFKHGGKRN